MNFTYDSFLFYYLANFFYPLKLKTETFNASFHTPCGYETTKTT